MVNYKKLYKIDENDNVRVWWMESDHEKYRTCSGVLNGKIVESGWKYPDEKNVGKVNSTSVHEQVESEVNARYTRQRYQGKYHDSVEAAKVVGAKFHEPMLAQKYDAKTRRTKIYSQPKLDGVRCVISDGGMFSRQGKPFLSSPHIMNALQDLINDHPELVIDGELYNHDLKTEFEKIISLVRKTKPTEEDIAESGNNVQYHIYDCFDLNESNMLFEDRFRMISNYIAQYVNDPSIKLVKTEYIEDENDLDKLFSTYLEDGYEGQMIRYDSVYEHRRSKNLLKRKEFEDMECEIVDIVEGVGNWAGYAKSIIVKFGDITQDSGMRGTFEFANELLVNKEKYIGTDVTVRYQGKTNTGKMRFPVATYFWKQKRDV